MEQDASAPNAEDVLRDAKAGHRTESGVKGSGHAVAAAIQEWRSLQKQIQAHSATVAKNERDVIEGINLYRMTLSGVSFKPLKVDVDIWETYNYLVAEIPVTNKTTARWPLYLRPLKKLRELENTWSEILSKQKNLLDVLSKAPKSVEFYNRIHLARIKKHELELRETEIARRNAEAREAIDKALAVVSQPGESGGIATLGSTILRLEDAKKFWNERIQEISNLETNSHMDPEEVITVFRSLEDTISTAPSMAEEVKAVEVMFVRLMSSHEELAVYGKSVIPPEDLSRILIMVQEEIPKLWATGAWDKLKRSLDEVSSFVKFYDLPVRSELSLAERRKPGLTKALLMGANNLPISQATPLIRSLVSAIDSRDRFMRGHSDTVARLVTQIGKKMNWGGEDLEMLEIAALLHDVGKIAIPENVLTKIDPLTPEEWKTIQMHPYHGARIVKSLDTLNRIIPWIYHHQERWDGGGYPDGLSKDTIPEAARIIGVSEAYTVMITDQPKRKAFSIDQAADEIKKGAGAQFDPQVAEAFSDSISAAVSEAEVPT